jgi:hypothetical protein
MIHRQKAKLLLWFTTLLSVLVLGVTPALAGGVLLTVNRAGAGTGTVTSDPAGIDCGADCTEWYGPETQVTLTATPDAGSVFAGWSGDCVRADTRGAGNGPNDRSITFTMFDDMTCTANFGLPVGGIAVPVNRLGLLAPWMGVAAAASLAALMVALVRRRRST